MADQRPGHRAAAGHGPSDRRGPGVGDRGVASGSAVAIRAEGVPQLRGECHAGARRSHHLRPGREAAGAAEPGKRLGPAWGRPVNAGRRLGACSSWKPPGRGAAGCGDAGRGTSKAWVDAPGGEERLRVPGVASAYLLNGR